tara:strand:- start:296 stop:505 length:210 start_codon:yes stop_codon:yes gene_type:complete
MATSWKIQNKRFDSGPNWEEWDTAADDEWEVLTALYWEWTKDWTFSGKASATDNWTVITGTKGKLATET